MRFHEMEHAIAVRQRIKTDPFACFRAAAETFRADAGRPHGDKWQFLQSTDFLLLYADVEKFCKVRDVLDPKRVFTNAPPDRVLP